MIYKFLKNLNFIPAQYFNEFFYTTITFLIFLVIYAGIFFFIKKQDWSNDKKHKHYVSTRNLIFFVFIISLIFIWSGEIKTFIFSAAAIFGATLIVVKELLLAILGSVLTNKVFNVGDYIEYDGIRGRIIDRNFFNTRVLITEPFQNKELIFPNMHYITTRITNLSRFGKLQTYTLDIGVSNIKSMYKHSEKALEIANNAIEPHKIKFQEHFKQQQREQLFFEVPDISPKITYDLNDSNKPHFTLHYIAHPLDKIKIEGLITKDYLIYISEHGEEKKMEGKDENKEI